ncbi:MAG: hypothetical protein LWY06_03670, partial [Firmicutes bacterium]|nr:hypothetical protein [Bacillota bacterium]
EMISKIIFFLKNNKVTIYSSESLWEKPLTKDKTFRDCIFCLKDRDFKRLLSAQITNGPFWEKESIQKRQYSYKLNDEDITGHSIAEAAELQFQKKDNPVIVSFQKSEIGSNSRLIFNKEVCEVVKESSTPNAVLIKNLFTIKQAKEWCNIGSLYQNWDEFLDSAKDSFKNLRFIGRVRKTLNEVNFSIELCKEFRNQLLFLNEIWFCELFKENSECRNNRIKIAQDSGYDISDESDTTKNNRKLSDKRTFILPDRRKEKFYYHLKVKYNNEPYRIHFFEDRLKHIIWIGHMGKHLPI